jgi:holo-[acyl-carrier protein] synthase
MIQGQGIDIVQISRIRHGLERFGQAFARRLLRPEEWREFKCSVRAEAFLAKRFAAKEALAKALGTGFRDGLSFQHVQISHNDAGKPVFVLTGRAAELLSQYTDARLSLSISDEKEYAVAIVTLEVAGPILSDQGRRPSH